MEAAEDAVDQPVGADVLPDPKAVDPRVADAHKVVAGHRVAVAEEDSSEGPTDAIVEKCPTKATQTSTPREHLQFTFLKEPVFEVFWKWAIRDSVS